MFMRRMCVEKPKFKTVKLFILSIFAMRLTFGSKCQWEIDVSAANLRLLIFSIFMRFENCQVIIEFFE